MNYIKRAISEIVVDLSSQFPVLMLTGARQVGKTTLLKELSAEERQFVTLDDPMARALAKQDPALFTQTYRPPILIDEFQYAPELLPYIKMAVDAKPDVGGQYWLTGSQQFNLMKVVGESLAGRVGILPLGGITQGEEEGRRSNGSFSVSTSVSPMDRFDGCDSVYRRILRGTYPAVVSGQVRNLQVFYRSYLNTYLERDVRQLAMISDESRFLAFIKVVAARTGNLLNLSDISKEVGIAQPTARAWLSILESSGIVFLLRPYSANIGARIVKTPKVYFMDTGLCCYLTGWTDVRVLRDGAMNGAILETFVISEVVRSFWNVGREAPIWFYRDKGGTEIDLLIEENGGLTPVEIKRTATPLVEDVRNFVRVQEKGLHLGNGALVCLAEQAMPLPGGVRVVPVGSI